MKVLLSLAVVVAVALAEPPSSGSYPARDRRPDGPAFNLPERQQSVEPPPNRQQQQQQQQYFFARQEDASSGPYPARGWRLDGPAFNLPERQQTLPQRQYGAPSPQQPQQQYGPPSQPQQQYGPPSRPEQEYGAPEDQEPSPRQQVPSRFRTWQFAQQRQQQQQQPRQGYGAPARQQQGYPGPQPAQPQPQASYGGPQQAQRQYGQPEYPSTTEYPSATEIDESATEAEPETEQVRSGSELEDEAGDIDVPRGQKQRQRQEQQRGEYFVALPDGRLQRVRYASRQDLEEMAYIAKIRAENVEPLRGPIYAYAPLRKLEVAPGNLQVQALGTVVPLAENRLTIQAEARPRELLAPAPSVETEPLAQVQYQLDNPPTVVPLSSSFTTVTNTYGAASARLAPVDDRFILAINPSTGSNY